MVLILERKSPSYSRINTVLDQGIKICFGYCCRPKIRFELHGFTYLMEVIDLILRDAEARGTGLTDQEVDLCSEILKILFNLTVTVDRNNFDEVSRSLSELRMFKSKLFLEIV